MVTRTHDEDKRFGNQFWKLAKKPTGSPRKFKSVDDMWNKCCEYFEWVTDNPLYAAEVVKFQGTGTLTDVPKMRAMTTGGLCIFLGIGVSTWNDYRNRPGFEEFSEVIAQVEEIIRTQKFEGACADMLNPNIIARDLGLVDKKDVDLKTNSNIPKLVDDMTEEEAAEMCKDVLG